MDMAANSSSSPSFIQINNTSLLDLICLFHSIHDTVQLLPSERYTITSNGSLKIFTDKNYYLHIYRPGLFGAISLRTRLSTGYGYLVESNSGNTPGTTYSVRTLSNKDEDGNLCQLLKHIHRSDSVKYESIEIMKYHFGDMLLKPSIRTLGTIFHLPSISFDSNLYRDYLDHRNGRHMSFYEEDDFPNGNQHVGENHAVTSSRDNLITANVTERELWGIFFDQIYYVGIWAIHTVSYLTIDEIELQEPYLYIGLPSVSLLNMILRSRYDHAITSYLRLIDGRIVTETTCPESYRLMFQILLQTKQEMCQLEPKIQIEEIEWLREVLLYSGSNKELKGGDRGISEERQQVLHRLFSSLVSIATQLTQQRFYKENFCHVLENIGKEEQIKLSSSST